LENSCGKNEKQTVFHNWHAVTEQGDDVTLAFQNDDNTEIKTVLVFTATRLNGQTL
jgi:hypothetical protein